MLDTVLSILYPMTLFIYKECKLFYFTDKAQREALFFAQGYRAGNWHSQD